MDNGLNLLFVRLNKYRVLFLCLSVGCILGIPANSYGGLEVETNKVLYPMVCFRVPTVRDAPLPTTSRSINGNIQIFSIHGKAKFDPPISTLEWLFPSCTTGKLSTTAN